VLKSFWKASKLSTLEYQGSHLIAMEQSVNNSMSDTELFDMLFGVQQQQQNKQNNNDNQDSPSSPVNSTMSEPANHHGMIERWEPGEILDSDFEMNSSFSTSSMTTSPQHYRSSHHHHQRPRRITVSYCSKTFF
jgi:hypothetical protein